MKKVEIGIDNIQYIYLRLCGDVLRVHDESNDGVIECTIENLRKTIRLIEDVYKKHKDLNPEIYGSHKHTIQLSYYQVTVGKNVCRGNYILIHNMPTIIKMLKSVKVEKKKYILNKYNLCSLCVKDLESLKQTMKRRKKVLTDENGYKYIEV